MWAGRHLERRKTENLHRRLRVTPEPARHRQRSTAGRALSERDTGCGRQGGPPCPGRDAEGLAELGRRVGSLMGGPDRQRPWRPAGPQLQPGPRVPGHVAGGMRGRGTGSGVRDRDREDAIPPQPGGAVPDPHPVRRGSWETRRSWTGSTDAADQAQHGDGRVQGDRVLAARGSVRWKEQGGGHGPGQGLREEGGPTGQWSVTQGHARLPLGSQARRVEGCGLRVLIYTRWLNPDNPQQTARTPPGCSRAQTGWGGKARHQPSTGPQAGTHWGTGGGVLASAQPSTSGRAPSGERGEAGMRPRRGLQAPPPHAYLS